MTEKQIQDCIVYVIDDDEDLLRSLEWLLLSVPFKVKSYLSASAFLADINQKSLGCIVTDLRMPEMNGIELHQSLRQRNIDLPVIIMTAHGKVNLAVDAMKQGVVDFIEKPFDDHHFINTINSALRRAIANANDQEEIVKIRERFSTLTDREQQVCELVSQGQKSKAISSALNISEKTVEAHRGQVMRKMRATSLANLVRMLILAGPGDQ